MLLKLKGKRNHGFKTAWRKGFGKRSEVNLKLQSPDGVLVHSFMPTPPLMDVVSPNNILYHRSWIGLLYCQGRRKIGTHTCLNTVGLTPVWKQLNEQEF